MSTRHMWQPWHEVQWTREYCRSSSAAIFIAWSFRLEPLYKLSTLLFTYKGNGDELDIRMCFVGWQSTVEMGQELKKFLGDGAGMGLAFTTVSLFIYHHQCLVICAWLLGTAGAEEMGRCRKFKCLMFINLSRWLYNEMLPYHNINEMLVMLLCIIKTLC